MNPENRIAYNELFYKRLIARRPDLRKRYEPLLKRRTEREAAPTEAREKISRLFESLAREPLERVLDDSSLSRAIVLETIVKAERPVLFVRGRNFDTEQVTVIGQEAQDLVKMMKGASEILGPLLPLVGRIDVENFPNNFPFVGTGWFVDEDIVVTNRHVASLIAEWSNRKFVFSAGVRGGLISAELNNAHEFDDSTPPDPKRICEVKEVLYIESESGPNDIAFLRVQRPVGFEGPRFFPIAVADSDFDVPVCAIGYPAKANRNAIPDQAEMEMLYRGHYDVKRASPGYTMPAKEGLCLHDCSTLGGASGSVLVNLKTGQAVGLHFAGLYHEENYAVPASVLASYVDSKRWNRPPEIESSNTRPKPVPSRPAPVPSSTPSTIVSSSLSTQGGSSVSASFLLTITANLSPYAPPVQPSQGASQPLTVARVEKAISDYWKSRPEGVVAARFGYFDEGDQIGDRPCIAVSVVPRMWADFNRSGPQDFDGVPIRYLPADAMEQVEAMPEVEAIASIAYDDDARGGEKFSFDQIDEEMEVTMHVGPEYSWEVLRKFLSESQGNLVSAMYEFQADHIREALEGRLRDGASLELVLDNATFAKPKPTEDAFDRVAVFEDWAHRFHFKRIVAPEGSRGLIANSYHIKVTVRDDDTFWLSSGNWKGESSQPIITPQELALASAGQADLKGNREWHVVIKNSTLATRFRSHIQQDFTRSQALGGRVVPKSQPEDETFIDVPLDETVVLERPAPSHTIKPVHFTDTIEVKPLLTPDMEGTVYSKAVLRLIRSAKQSLLFQIPYIGMTTNPEASRGYIDDLIEALIDKLTTLDDARVILRSGSSGYSSPTHSAWYFKSKGVDINSRLRVIENHHTKGMIVDGQRILLGSHNWSAAGVTLNRDASLLFDHERIAKYYTEAFEIDWQRSSKVNPRQFVKPEAPVLEAVGDAPPAGYVRMSLSEWLKDD